MLILVGMFFSLFVYGLIIGKIGGAIVAFVSMMLIIWTDNMLKNSQLREHEEVLKYYAETEARLHQHETECSGHTL